MIKITTSNGITIETEAGGITVGADTEQKCLHLWGKGAYVNKDGIIRLSVDGNHIQIWERWNETQDE